MWQYILLSGHGEMRRRRMAHASRLRTLAIPGQYLGALARPRDRTCRRSLLAAAAAALLREQRALRYTPAAHSLRSVRMALPHAKSIFQASKPLIKDAAKSYAKQNVTGKADLLLGTGLCGCGPGEGAGMRLAHGARTRKPASLSWYAVH